MVIISDGGYDRVYFKPTTADVSNSIVKHGIEDESQGSIQYSELPLSQFGIPSSPQILGVNGCQLWGNNGGSANISNYPSYPINNMLGLPTYNAQSLNSGGWNNPQAQILQQLQQMQQSQQMPQQIYQQMPKQDQSQMQALQQLTQQLGPNETERVISERILPNETQRLISERMLPLNPTQQQQYNNLQQFTNGLPQLNGMPFQYAMAAQPQQQQQYMNCRMPQIAYRSEAKPEYQNNQQRVNYAEYKENVPQNYQSNDTTYVQTTTDGLNDRISSSSAAVGDYKRRDQIEQDDYKFNQAMRSANYSSRHNFRSGSESSAHFYLK